MATIRKRGRYHQAQIRIKGYPQKSGSFDTLEQARTWAAETEAAMRAGRYIDRKEAESTLLSDALDRYKDYVQQNSRQPRREINRCEFLKQYAITKYSLAAVRPTHVREFVAERENEGCSGNTIRLDLALLSRLFNIARIEWGLAVTNPITGARRPKIKARDRRLSSEEQNYLMSAAGSINNNLQFVILWALETAMRRSEIAGLRWSDIDIQSRVAHLEKTKNGESRDVPLSSTAMSVLAALQREKSDLVFCMSANAITLSYRRAMDAARRRYAADCDNGLTVSDPGFLHDLTFHDLRHEATSRLFEIGLSVAEVRTITGHKSLATLSRYTHLRAVDIVEKLG